jgi:hypothetical protein
MTSMKMIRISSCTVALLGAAVTVSILPGHVPAAVITYNFDVNGALQSPSNFGVTSGNTYDWDDTANGGFWSNDSSSSTGNIATNGWVQGNFPKFRPTGTPTYTVTVSNVEDVAGMFFSTAQHLTLDPIGAGQLNIVSGLQGVLGSGSADVTINVPITGPGEIQPSNGGNLRLNATNTYSGGTNLVSTSTLIHFNNGSAFGSNFINMGVAGMAPLLASGGATVTLPNNFTSSVNGAGINFAADVNTPVISTGTWTLGANNLPLKNNGGNAASTLTLSNTISGSGNITLSSNFGSAIIFSGANSYSGTTAITGPGGAGTGNVAATLKLGAADTIASSSSVILAGGILDPGGFNHAMTATTLALNTSTNPSVIDFLAGASEIDFKNSSAVSWPGSILNLTNWDPNVDKLRFGTDSTGLTAAQVAKIEFNGSGLGTAFLDENGYVVVPEPSATMLLLIGAGAIFVHRRRTL